MIEKLISFADQERDRLKKSIIFQRRNVYYIFETYQIESISNNCFYVYKNREFVEQFYSSSSALAWCIADKFNQIELAKSIMVSNLDQQRLVADIELSQQLRNKRTWSHDLLNNKIHYKISRLNSVRSQLKKMIDQAKYLQNKGFKYETH
jgi:hypothetical protein